MKKGMLLLSAGVLSLTMFAFVAPKKTNQTITMFANGNYWMEDVDFNPDDDQALTSLQQGDINGVDWFLVRCRSNGKNKFNHATIAGSGCAYELVENATATEIEQANSVRQQVDEIMSHYN